MKAAKKGVGVRLTAEEVRSLSRDQAIADAAGSDDISDREGKEAQHYKESK